MDLSIGDRVFYTRSNGLQPPATVVGTAEDGLLHLEYYQDGLRVVNRQCKMESISFYATRTRKAPLKVLQSSLGRLILRVFPRGVPGGFSGGT